MTNEPMKQLAPPGIPDPQSQSQPVAPPPKISWLFLGVVVVTVWLLFFNGFENVKGWLTAGPPVIVLQTATASTILNTQSLPTAHTAIQSISTAIVTTNPNVAQNGATATSMYQTAAALQVATPEPVISTTGAIGAPDRQTNVLIPSAVPLETNPDADAHRSAPINIQDTHQCLHGQIWSDMAPRGCHNPTR